MLANALIALICMAIGFLTGRVRPKIFARTIKKHLQIKAHQKHLFKTSKDVAINYLIDLEKQTFESRHKALSHLTLANLAGITLSGTLILKGMVAFHWLAITSYTIGIILALVGHLALGDSRRAQFEKTLDSIRKSKDGNALIYKAWNGAATFARIITFCTYLAFGAGIIITTLSFSARNDCIEYKNNISLADQFTCRLAHLSSYYDTTNAK